VERVKSVKFLTVHTTEDLYTNNVVKKMQHRLFNLRRMRKFVLAPKTFTNFYRVE
jgi:hypothetical protein